MSLQASFNAMLGSAAILKKLGGIQKDLKDQAESYDNFVSRMAEQTWRESDANQNQTIHNWETDGARSPRNNAEAADRAEQHIQDADTAPNSGAELRKRFARERERFSVGGQAYPFMVPGQVVPGTIRPGTISAPASLRGQRGADTSNLTGGNT